MLPICFAGTKILDIAKNHVAKGIFITKNMANQAEWGSIILRYVPNWVMTMQLRGSLQGDRALIKTKDAKTQVAQDFAMNALGSVLAGASQGKSSGRTVQQHRPTTIASTKHWMCLWSHDEGQPFNLMLVSKKYLLIKKSHFRKSVMRHSMSNFPPLRQ